jgi:hypothetical protein
MEWNQRRLVSACSQAVDRDAVCFAEPARPKGTDSKKGSFSAVGKRVIYPVSPPEARFRQNVWQSGTRSVCRKADEFSRSGHGTYRWFDGVPEKRLSFPEHDKARHNRCVGRMKSLRQHFQSACSQKNG